MGLTRKFEFGSIRHKIFGDVACQSAVKNDVHSCHIDICVGMWEGLLHSSNDFHGDWVPSCGCSNFHWGSGEQQICRQTWWKCPCRWRRFLQNVPPPPNLVHLCPKVAVTFWFCFLILCIHCCFLANWYERQDISVHTSYHHRACPIDLCSNPLLLYYQWWTLAILPCPWSFPSDIFVHRCLWLTKESTSCLADNLSHRMSTLHHSVQQTLHAKIFTPRGGMINSDRARKEAVVWEGH